MTYAMLRRDMFAGAALLGLSGAAGAASADTNPFIYSLNTSTIRGQNLSIVEEVAIAAKAGYQAIEPWINELEQFMRKAAATCAIWAGASRTRACASKTPSASPNGSSTTRRRRKKGLEETRRAMDMVQQIGGQRLAAPPVGATKQADLSLLRAAERYRALLEIGDKIGVVPQVELWGFSRSLSRLGECALVAIESGHPQACILADVYHLYKGGSGFGGLQLLSARRPASLPHERLPRQAAARRDHRRPPRLPRATASLRSGHAARPAPRRLPRRLVAGAVQPRYWKQDALAAPRTGLEKMRAVVQMSLERLTRVIGLRRHQYPLRIDEDHLMGASNAGSGDTRRAIIYCTIALIASPHMAMAMFTRVLVVDPGVGFLHAIA